MNSTQWFVIGVVGLPLALVMWGKLRIDMAALLIAVVLGIGQYLGMGVLGAEQSPRAAALAIGGFSQPVISTLIGLFIMTFSLDKVGITRWIARRLLQLGGTSERRMIGLFTTTAATLSLVMNNVAAGALLLPSVMDVARRGNIHPSKLLMPVAFGTLLGGGATYFTTANIVMSDLLATTDPPQRSLGILDFTGVGGLMALVGISFITLMAWRILPARGFRADSLIPYRDPAVLEDAYEIGERLWKGLVLPSSSLINRTLHETSIGGDLGVMVVAIVRGRQMLFASGSDLMIKPHDRLLIIGHESRVKALEKRGVTIRRELTQHQLSNLSAVLVEVIPAPHSPVEGKCLKDLDFRRRYGFSAIALWREGRSIRTDVGSFSLKFGDSLLMIGSPENLRRLRANPDVILLEPNYTDLPINPRLAALALAITGAAVTASIAGLPVYLAMLAGALAVILTQLVSMEEAYRAIEWQTIFMIAGMYTVSVAIVQTGLADMIGEAIVTLFMPMGALGLAAGAYLLALLLTQVMGSQVTALVVGPITITAAINAGVNPQAIAVVTAIGCSGAFLTPMAHSVNMLMMGPGDYQFGDYARLGWGLLLVTFITMLIGVEIFWGL